jgi:hypothetical protein
MEEKTKMKIITLILPLVLCCCAGNLSEDNSKQQAGQQSYATDPVEPTSGCHYQKVVINNSENFIMLCPKQELTPWQDIPDPYERQQKSQQVERIQEQAQQLGEE